MSKKVFRASEEEPDRPEDRPKEHHLAFVHRSDRAANITPATSRTPSTAMFANLDSFYREVQGATLPKVDPTQCPPDLGPTYDLSSAYEEVVLTSQLLPLEPPPDLFDPNSTAPSYVTGVSSVPDPYLTDPSLRRTQLRRTKMFRSKTSARVFEEFDTEQLGVSRLVE